MARGLSAIVFSNVDEPAICAEMVQIYVSVCKVDFKLEDLTSLFMGDC